VNLLVLTPLVPAPPHDGDKLRLFHFLHELKKRGHVIDLFCVTRVRADLHQVEKLRPLCRTIYQEALGPMDFFFNLVGGSLWGQSLNVASHFSPKLREALRAYWKSGKGKNTDAVLAHRLRMAPMAFEGNPGVPVVLDLTDCLGAYAQALSALAGARWGPKFLARWDRGLIAREEVEWGKRAAATVTISSRDAEALKAQGLAGDKISVVPNGLDLKPRARSFQRPAEYPKGRPVVCFAGNMGYFPNEDGILWFHREVWPRVRQAVPEAFLAAVGGTPTSRLMKKAKEGEFRVTGWVPEIEPYVASARLTIAPLRIAAGMQNKVALSLGLGVPVVATPAAAGWMSEKERGFLSIAKDPQAFAQAVIQTLKNPAGAQARARRGRTALLKNYTWTRAGRTMDELLKSVVRR